VTNQVSSAELNMPMKKKEKGRNEKINPRVLDRQAADLSANLPHCIARQIIERPERQIGCWIPLIVRVK